MQPVVMIIGAGAMGCSTAYHLARKGVASHVFEKESIAARASGKARVSSTLVIVTPFQFEGAMGIL